MITEGWEAELTARKKSDEKLLIWRYTSIPGVIDTLRRRQLALLDPQTWDDRNDRHFMLLYKEHREANSLYAMCGAMCPETYHHWRVFTGAGDGGACIVIHRQPLQDRLRNAELPNGDRVRCDEVEYLSLKQTRDLGPSDMDSLPFLKRIGFEDEDEYRIVVESTEDQGSAYRIDFPLEWIDRIYLNPWLPASLAESVIDTLLEIDGCTDLDVRHSSLIDSTTWKKAGDRVAGKRPGKDRIPRRIKPRRSS